jgi:hypothetical protein
MKKSLLWLSAATVFILALRAELPMLADLFSARNKQAVAGSKIQQHALGAAAMPNIWYVTTTGAGIGDGSSWANASDNLQAMIDGSAEGDEVWVASGSYKPNFNAVDADDRTKTFYLRTGVSVYGGFSGNESFLEERNWDTNKTYLSGDFLGNDQYSISPETGTAENAYHVVTALNLQSAVLDGFVIVGGYASDADSTRDSTFIDKSGHSTYYDYGGGVYVDSTTLNLQNCTFRNNYAAQGGAADRKSVV